MTDMTDVLAVTLAGLDELTDGDGFTYSWFDMDPADLARELAAALSAAGFGLVADAKSGARRETTEDILEGLSRVAPDDVYAIGFVEGYRDACLDEATRSTS